MAECSWRRPGMFPRRSRPLGSKHIYAVLENGGTAKRAAHENKCPLRAVGCRTHCCAVAPCRGQRAGRWHGQVLTLVKWQGWRKRPNESP